MEALHERIAADRLYAWTGIQVLSFNSLYQLYADGMAVHSQAIFPGSICRSTCSIAGAQTRCRVHECHPYRHGCARQAAVVGRSFRMRRSGPFSRTRDCCAWFCHWPLARTVGGFGCTSRHAACRAACHDTASAIAGIHAQGNDWAYISSGTWSLVGALLDQPCAGPESARLNFTNEGGVGGKICFLRNVNGLWLLNQCIEAWQSDGEHRTAEQLVEAASVLPAPEALLDVDDPQFFAPGRMPERIAMQLESNGVSAKLFLSLPAAKDQSDSSQSRRAIHHRTAPSRIADPQTLSTSLHRGWRQQEFLTEPHHSAGYRAGNSLWSAGEFNARQFFYSTCCAGKDASKPIRRVW